MIESNIKRHITEQPLEAQIIQCVNESAAEALDVLQLHENLSSGLIIESIEAFIVKVQKHQATEKFIDLEDIPFAFGALWGQQIVKEFGWHWVMNTFHENGGGKASGVVSEDRCLAIYPIHHLIDCINDPGVDVMIQLSFDMLKSGKLISNQAAQYVNYIDIISHCQ